MCTCKPSYAHVASAGRSMEVHMYTYGCSNTQIYSHACMYMTPQTETHSETMFHAHFRRLSLFVGMFEGDLYDLLGKTCPSRLLV